MEPKALDGNFVAMGHTVIIAVVGPALVVTTVALLWTLFDLCRQLRRRDPD